MRVRVCECGKQKIENDKNVIYVLLLASIYIKVCALSSKANVSREESWGKSFVCRNLSLQQNRCHKQASARKKAR